MELADWKQKKHSKYGIIQYRKMVEEMYRSMTETR